MDRVFDKIFGQITHTVGRDSVKPLMGYAKMLKVKEEREKSKEI